MGKNNVLSLLRSAIAIVIRTVLILLYKSRILIIGIFCGVLGTRFIVENRDPGWMIAAMNKFAITRSGIRCESASYMKYITIPDRLVALDSNLLQTIQNEARSINVFPLDIIIDINQLDPSYAFNQGVFEISSTPNRIRESVDLSLQESEFRNSKITFYHLAKMSRRYDLSYDNFLPFYKFYLSALNATQDQIEECIANYPNMSPKEKALALSAVYIFEQRARKPTRESKRRYDDVKLKYATYKTSSSFNEGKWQYLEMLINSEISNEEIAFDAIPNEGIVKDWERSLRQNALLYQYNLSCYNPYCPIYSDWAPLCRKAPLNFLYALLWSETEATFLNSEKEFPRTGLFNMPHDFELDLISRDDNGGNISEERIDRPFLTDEEKERMSILYDLRGRTSKYPIPNDYVITMREYLKTQASSLRHFYPSGLNGYYVFNLDIKVPANTIYLGEPFFNANTSYEAKTIGFIASTLLHARGLFDE